MHYNGVIRTRWRLKSPVSRLTVIVCSGTDQTKHQIPAPLLVPFVGGIQRWPVGSLHKGPVPRKMIPSDDVIMDMVTHNFVQFEGQARLFWCWNLFPFDAIQSLNVSKILQYYQSMNKHKHTDKIIVSTKIDRAVSAPEWLIDTGREFFSSATETAQFVNFFIYENFDFLKE